jgi:large subunit ribosomal protein L13e
LVLFPRKDPKKPKKGEASVEEQQKAAQQKGTVLPILATSVKLQSMKLSDIDPKQSAYATLRKARSDARLVGIRKKRAEKKASEEAMAAAKGAKVKD